MSLIPLGFWAASGGLALPPTFDHIETVQAAGSSSSVVFSNLDALSDYSNLQIRYTSRAFIATDLYIRCQNDTTNNYSWHQIQTYSTGSVGSSYGSTQNAIRIQNGVCDDTNPENQPGIIDILEFSNSQKSTTFRTFTGNQGNPLSLGFYSGMYTPTTPISTIELFLTSSTWRSGRFSLYGAR